MTIDYEILWSRFREALERDMKRCVMKAEESVVEWDLEEAKDFSAEAYWIDWVLKQMTRFEMSTDCEWRKEDGK